MKGQHVMKHNPGVWNGIWSDMYIETTFMRCGHGKGGIVGISLKSETLKTWALSLHTSCQLENALFDMSEGTNDVIHMSHKEEGKSRVLSDKTDREGIRQKLELCIDTLNSTQHADRLINVVNGKVAQTKYKIRNHRNEIFICKSSYKLTENIPLPPQKVVLTVTENKKQLIGLICEELHSDNAFHKHEVQKFVITGFDNTPFQISAGKVIHNREYLYTIHEEADTIIIQQMIAVSRENPEVISFVSDDTDVFVLLLHYYQECNVSACVLMESPVQERTIVDIGQTVRKHSSVISELLPANALSGCDTVACYFGIGKGQLLRYFDQEYRSPCLEMRQ
ncbi:hypothetical protein PR048_029246 [Dryococelus australis]|uniref:Uncharacterized protein n=1 Tax=Dryococelus australis TaxID=614101 RepID=A0ABQ9GCT9_9NEOP|nr:hypothetical protein PR048_029246 [Dryococelus australis]